MKVLIMNRTKKLKKYARNWYYLEHGKILWKKQRKAATASTKLVQKSLRRRKRQKKENTEEIETQ